MPASRPSIARALVPLIALLAAFASGCADQRRIWFENQRSDTVTVSIDGDRLVILRPHSGQWLPYSTAAWAWPRRVDVATWREGTPLWSAHLDADDLARNRWIIYVRP